MKWFYAQGSERLGPVPTEQLLALSRDGVVTDGTLVWRDGMAEWQAFATVKASLLPAPPGGPPKLTAAPAATSAGTSRLTMKQLRDKSESTALALLYVAAIPMCILLLVLIVVSYGAWLFILLFFWFAQAIGKCWFAAHLRTSAVRVSERQFPELHRAAQECCAKLGLPPVEVYVMQDTVWNAFAMKLRGRRTVVLLSGAVDAILLKGDYQQLKWVVGHEIGHHAAGHLDLSRRLANLGAWFVWGALWHSRRAEFTCDRIGLYCTGSLLASQRALASATVGAQLASQLDLAEAQAQWAAHSKEFFVQYRTLYSTHPALLCRMEALSKAAAELGVPA
ncbi:MAG: M48 family metalloprotease [Limisphaerales bacterium]